MQGATLKATLVILDYVCPSISGRVDMGTWVGFNVSTKQQKPVGGWNECKTALPPPPERSEVRVLTPGTDCNSCSDAAHQEMMSREQ